MNISLSIIKLVFSYLFYILLRFLIYFTWFINPNKIFIKIYLILKFEFNLNKFRDLNSD